MYIRYKAWLHSLTVTDSYGASSVSNRDLRIDAEGNIAPIADIKVYNR